MPIEDRALLSRLLDPPYAIVYPCLRLKYCTARSCFSAASRVGLGRNSTLSASAGEARDGGHQLPTHSVRDQRFAERSFDRPLGRSCQGKVRATRKPVLPPRFVGRAELRSAERTSRAGLSKEPPRHTRSAVETILRTSSSSSITTLPVALGYSL